MADEGQNNFLVWDENNANILPQEEYVIDTDRINGFKAGLARSIAFNKVLKQASTMASAMGELIKRRELIADDSDVQALADALENTLVTDGANKSLSNLDEVGEARFEGKADTSLDNLDEFGKAKFINYPYFCVSSGNINPTTGKADLLDTSPYIELFNAGTYPFTVPEDADYDIELCGGGGGGSYVDGGRDQYGDTARAWHHVWAGGSGAYWKGTIHLTAGNYNLVVGGGGLYNNYFNSGGTGGSTYIEDSAGEKLVIAGGAIGGLPEGGSWYLTRTKGVVTVNAVSQIVTTDISKDGIDGINRGVAHDVLPSDYYTGTPSVVDDKVTGYGAGGAYGQNGIGGFIKVKSEASNNLNFKVGGNYPDLIGYTASGEKVLSSGVQSIRVTQTAWRPLIGTPSDSVVGDYTISGVGGEYSDANNVAYYWRAFTPQPTATRSDWTNYLGGNNVTPAGVIVTNTNGLFATGTYRFNIGTGYWNGSVQNGRCFAVLGIREDGTQVELVRTDDITNANPTNVLTVPVNVVEQFKSFYIRRDQNWAGTYCNLGNCQIYIRDDVNGRTYFEEENRYIAINNNQGQLIRDYLTTSVNPATQTETFTMPVMAHGLEFITNTQDYYMAWSFPQQIYTLATDGVPYYAFNNNTGTSQNWYIIDRDPTPENPFYLYFKFAKPTKVSKVNIWNANIEPRNFKEGEIQFSNDQVTWDTLYTFTDFPNVTGSAGSFDIETDNFYTYFRLKMTSNYGATAPSIETGVAIGEISFEGESLRNTLSTPYVWQNDGVRPSITQITTDGKTWQPYNGIIVGWTHLKDGAMNAYQTWEYGRNGVTNAYRYESDWFDAKNDTTFTLQHNFNISPTKQHIIVLAQLKTKVGNLEAGTIGVFGTDIINPASVNGYSVQATATTTQLMLPNGGNLTWCTPTTALAYDDVSLKVIVLGGNP